MSNFYTSEILTLPQNWLSLTSTEQFELARILVRNYLEQQTAWHSCQNIIFFNQNLENFTIEEIRKLQWEAEHSASLSGKAQRVFVLLKFDSASLPAQQATLKIIEESPEDTLIVLLCYQIDKILETILSRCIMISSSSLWPKLSPETLAQLQIDSATAVPEFIETFIWPTNYSQAIKIAESYKDRGAAQTLIATLLTQKNLNHASKTSLLRAYQDLDRNQNVQLVLENCFFSLVHLGD